VSQGKAILSRVVISDAVRASGWMRDAACLDASADLFFPHFYGHDHSTDRRYAARDVNGCKVCDPIRVCRLYRRYPGRWL